MRTSLIVAAGGSGSRFQRSLPRSGGPPSKLFFPLDGKPILARTGINIVFRAGSGTPYSRQANILEEAGKRQITAEPISISKFGFVYKVESFILISTHELQAQEARYLFDWVSGGGYFRPGSLDVHPVDHATDTEGYASPDSAPFLLGFAAWLHP